MEDISGIVEQRLGKLGVQLYPCSKCGRKIFWVKTKTGRSQPSTTNLISHFADCPKAQYFKNKEKFRKSLG